MQHPGTFTHVCRGAGQSTRRPRPEAKPSDRTRTTTRPSLLNKSRLSLCIPSLIICGFSSLPSPVLCHLYHLLARRCPFAAACVKLPAISRSSAHVIAAVIGDDLRTTYFLQPRLTMIATATHVPGSLRSAGEKVHTRTVVQRVRVLR